MWLFERERSARYIAASLSETGDKLFVNRCAVEKDRVNAGTKLDDPRTGAIGANT